MQFCNNFDQMSILYPEDDQISDEILLAYIQGSLTESNASRISEVIKVSKNTFLRYVSIKEALFLEHLGKDADSKREDFLVSRILPQEKPVNHIQIIIRFLKEKVIITSSDQSEIDFRSVMADFAFRGSTPGPISISRIVDGKELTLLLSPGERVNEQLLTVKIIPASKLRCDLIVDQVRVESIEDLAKQSIFQTPLTSEQSIELRFYKSNELLYSINLLLKTD